MKADLPLGGFLGILQNITKSFPYQNGLSFTNKICGFFFKRSVEIPKVSDHQFSTYVHIFQKNWHFVPPTMHSVVGILSALYATSL